MKNISEADPIIINEYTGQVFQTGDLFEEGVVSYKEGIQFDFSEIGCTILMTLDNPSYDETRDVRHGDLTLALVEIDEVIFIVVKFGDFLQVEAPFNINISQLRTLNGDNKKLSAELTNDKGYSLVIFLVNASNGMIRVIRQVKLSNQFSKEFKAAVERQNKLPFDIDVYNKKVDKIWREMRADDIRNKVSVRHKLQKGNWTVVE
jgi:hypothetical protein